ncbi:TerB family tellurite resistance protein [Pedobacter psychrodurus]|uniref:TerB family tellurite resistance protein n=1 Tax=Pedobacter psychrodurus TaxID=2530456 RepID=UPI00292D064E|nr:TerB family tellurite resistance protein [Pedobacter psychrodurus]
MGTRDIRSYLVALLLIFIVQVKGFAQSTEAQQLLLNVEKLSQLKNILKDMKKGYTVISTGYNAVKNISKGNFSIHEVFIDGLMLVSPEVRKYRRVADIITYQKDILSEYKRALKQFRSADVFNTTELNYVSSVYASLFSQSLDNLDELTMVITANNLRMNDEERLKAIDRIFGDTSDKLTFLRSFNREARLLMQQRRAAKTDVKGIKGLLINN